ncbi:hypothetical protein Tco_0477315 [Tanacetum coccineum]
MNSMSLAYTTLKRLGTEVQEELHHNERPTLQRLPIYCTPSAAINAPIPKPTLEDLASTAPSTKVLAKAEDSKKSAMAHVASGIAQKSLFVNQSDDDDDADDRVEISLITPIRSATTIPLGGNPGEGSAPSAAKVPKERLSRTIVLTFLLGVSIVLKVPPVVLPPSRALHKEWELPHEPTFNILNKELFKDPKVYETVVDQFPTQAEVAWIEALSDEQLFKKMNVFDLEKLVVVLKEKVTTSDVALVKSKGKSKDHKKRVKSLTKSLDQFTVEATRLASDLNEARRADARKREFLSLDVSAESERGLRMDQSEEQLAGALKKISNFVPRAQGRLLKATPLVATVDYPILDKIVDHFTHPLSVLIELGLKRLACLAPIPAPKVTPSQEQNEELVNVVVDTLDKELVDATVDKSAELASSNSPNIFVALSAEKEKEDVPPILKLFIGGLCPKGRVVRRLLVRHCAKSILALPSHYNFAYVGHIVVPISDRR